MITIVAKNTIKAGEKTNFINTARELIECSKKEEGNISYDLFEDINDENVLTFIECWKDKEAIGKHNSSEHFTRIIPVLGKLQAKTTEVTLYKIV